VSKQVVPALVDGLKDHSPLVRERCSVALGLIGLNERLYEAPEVLGAQAPKAIPALLTLLKDKEQSPALRGWAALSLGHIGPPARAAVPTLLEILRGDDPFDLQARALSSLGTINTAEADVIPAVLSVLRDRTRNPLRDAAAITLSKFGAKAEEAVPAMILALDVRDINDAERAKTTHLLILNALQEMGQLARAAVPAVTELANDRNLSPMIRIAAQHTLAHISP